MKNIKFVAIALKTKPSVREAASASLDMQEMKMDNVLKEKRMKDKFNAKNNQSIIMEMSVLSAKKIVRSVQRKGNVLIARIRSLALSLKDD